MHTAWTLYCIFWHRNPGIAWPVHIIAAFCLTAFIQTAWSDRPILYDRRTRLERGDFYDQHRNHPEDDNGTT